MAAVVVASAASVRVDALFRVVCVGFLYLLFLVGGGGIEDNIT